MLQTKSNIFAKLIRGHWQLVGREDGTDSVFVRLTFRLRTDPVVLK